MMPDVHATEATEDDRSFPAGGRSVVELSNRPLQRTGANAPLSVDTHQAGAARLFNNTVGRRAAPAVLLSTIT